MIRLNFDTTQHTAEISENNTIIAKYENVTTVRHQDKTYEVIVKLNNDVAAPVCKLPVEQTIYFLNHGN